MTPGRIPAAGIRWARYSGWQKDEDSGEVIGTVMGPESSQGLLADPEAKGPVSGALAVRQQPPNASAS